MNTGTMTVTDCTLSGNSSTDGGGGVYNTSTGTLILNNTTLANNASTGGVGGGGIKGDPGGTVTLSNTIMANNSASGPNDDCEGAMTSLGSNLVMDADGCAGLGSSDVTLLDPLLGPLQDNGGRTFTRLRSREAPPSRPAGAARPARRSISAASRVPRGRSATRGRSSSSRAAPRSP